jgi:hypothetical protein
LDKSSKGQNAVLRPGLPRADIGAKEDAMSDPVDTAPEYPPLNTLSTGIRCRCPRCGKGPLLKGYLTIRDHCPVCGLDYSFADPADGRPSSSCRASGSWA